VPTEEIAKSHTEKTLINKEKNVGHVSLEIANIYASIWPDSEDTTAIGINSRHKAKFMSSPQDDEEAERRPPDYCRCL
jgi:hypothetical protein